MGGLVYAGDVIMRKRNLLFAFILIFIFLSTASAEFIELQIPCYIGAQVKAVLPDGEEIRLGSVLRVPVKTKWPAYTASKWATPSTVCATAVNAVHMLVDVENNRGRIISLVPSITIAPAAENGAYFSINVPAGTGIFGGFAPFTGSEVRIKNKITNEERKLDNKKLTSDEILIIRSEIPDDNNNYYMVEFENRPAGRVIAYTKKGVEIIARVIRPVHGVGRFGGSSFQNIGRLRASHSGVICIATSKRNEVGGFQIMPLTHALTSSEMINAWNLTQWMIISPTEHNKNSMLEGHAPLFKKSFIPGVQLNDEKNMPDIWSSYYMRSLILCRISGGAWEKLPDISERNDNALKNITHIRIYYPSWNF